jgi:hypothetical protein
MRKAYGSYYPTCARTNATPRCRRIVAIPTQNCNARSTHAKTTTTLGGRDATGTDYADANRARTETLRSLLQWLNPKHRWISPQPATFESGRNRQEMLGGNYAP